MKALVLTTALAVIPLVASNAKAQVFGGDDGGAARAERMQQGKAAARGPQVGEGNPVPDARPKTSTDERAAARARRTTAGAQAARGPQMGEGDPIPRPAPAANR
ncbi:hypothetical protein VAR608DRAFT_4652 [Variovorax sp. HW608]|uniref:hypothetical protein n=1 Tax=Variovorax sp. HW608 TaxID=1034889 RepID=UPI00081FE5FE|nr:hypothetical protein [Variovorax sp. HW608]SCK47186.1 hypothetical protein VAR608DRAFT_4652 [Variovorax sp. HW608]